MRRMILPLLFGLIGTAILLSLGFWQLQRLAWKEAIIADIDARILDAPVPLPDTASPEADRYLPVTMTGRTTEDEIRVLASRRIVGAGFRIVTAFETDAGRRILLDRGFLPEAQQNTPRPPVEMTVTGNLHWPDETDGFTPDPDIARNMWFARDVDLMAQALNTEPLMVIARSTTEATTAVPPLPINTAGIPNDHLNYALTWFSLAAVWVGMTVFLLWRIRRRTV